MKFYCCDLCGQQLPQGEPRDNLFLILSKNETADKKIWRDMCDVCFQSVFSKLKEMLKVEDE